VGILGEPVREAVTRYLCVLSAGLLMLQAPDHALAAGEYTWQRSFGGPTLSDNALVAATAVDTSGNVVIVGDMQGSVNFGGTTLTSVGDYDVLVVRYSSAGAHLWSRRFGSTGSDRGFGVGVDSSGNVYVTGNFAGTVNFGGSALVSAGNADIFLAKYSSAGAHIWSKRIGGTGADVGNAISVKSDGTFAITGYFGVFGGPVDFGGGPLTSAGGSDVFVAEYASSGAHVWSRAIGGIGNDVGFSVAIDGTSGAVAITGYFTGNVPFACNGITSAGDADGFVLQYSPTGSLAWIRRFGGTSDDRGTAIAIAPGGSVVLTGYFNNTADFGGGTHISVGGADIFLAKYTRSGTWTWDKVFGTISGFGDLPKAVAVDFSGNIALTGSIIGGLDFGGGPLCPLCSTYDVFVAKFTSAGSHVWSHRYVGGNAYDDHGNAVRMDASGNVIVGGYFLDSVDFGGGNMTSPGGVSGFLAKFAP